VPAHLERDPLLVVDRPHLDRAGRGRELPARLHDLAHDRQARRLRRLQLRLGPREVDVLLQRRGDHDRRVAGSVAVPQRVDVVRERPALLGLQRVEEGRHRRAVEAGAEGPEDVLAAWAPAEGPALREVRGADRVALVVLQGGRGGPLSPPGFAVAAHAAESGVELPALLDRVLRDGRRLRQLDRLGRLVRVGEAGVEALQVQDEARHLVVRQPRPRRHRGVGHARADHAPDVVVGRQRPARCRAQLELAAREVAGPGLQVRGGGPLAVALVAVALGAVLLVRLSPGLELLRARRGVEDGRAEQGGGEGAAGGHCEPRAGAPRAGPPHFGASPDARGRLPVKSYRNVITSQISCSLRKRSQAGIAESQGPPSAGSPGPPLEMRQNR